MKIITHNKRLAKPILMVIATVGWMLVLHLCWRVVLTDSWDQTVFALGALAGIIGFSFPVWGHGYNQAIMAVWSAFMIFAFINAYMLVRKRKFLLHREWMMRGFA